MNLSEIEIIKGLSIFEFLGYFVYLCFSLYHIRVPQIKKKWLRLSLIFGVWVTVALTLFLPQPIEAWIFRFTMMLMIIAFYFLGKKETVESGILNSK